MLKTFAAGILRLKRRWAVEEVRRLITLGQFSEALAAADSLHEGVPDREICRLCLRGEIAFRQSRDAEAEALFREAVRLKPGYPDGHYGLSLLFYESGDVEAAVQHAQFAKGADATAARYLAQLGLCHLALKNYSLAELPLRQAVQANDLDKASWNNLGIVVRAKADFGEARFCFAKALQVDPDFALAKENLAQLESEVEETGGIWRNGPVADDEVQNVEPWMPQWAAIREQFRSGDYEGALHAADKLAAHWSDDAILSASVAELYGSAGDPQSAIDVLSAFLLRHPDDPTALAALGAARVKLGQYREAEKELTKAIQLGHESAAATAILAQALHHQDKYEAAVEVLRNVPEEQLTTTQKKQLAASLVMACEYEAAVELYRQMEAEGLSGLAGALGGYALALANLGRFEEALDSLGEVIEAYPAEPNIRSQRAQILLLRHEFALGWDDYGFRGLSATRNFRVLPVPEWRGEDLHGKTIVVLAEQGLGDQVMFASCLPDLLQTGAKHVVVEAIDRVAPTLARSFPECTVVATKQSRDLQWMTEFSGAEYYVPLADLPAHFRRDVADFPRQAYLRADPARVEFWSERLAQLGPRPWLGVSWRGGTPGTRSKLRTMKAEMLAPHIKRSGATWISLQYGNVAADLAALSQAGVELAHWNEAIKDLDEFAALISALDGVVTVCNTTVHYTGALGKPAWVMAPHIPEWRYGIDSDFMPWYPHARVLRQSKFGEWESVIEQAMDHAIAFVSRDATKAS